jgi:hypothetical protein
MIDIDNLPEPAGWIGYFEGNIVSFLQSRERVNIFLGNTGPAGQVVAVYEEQPKKQWVGLTDEEVWHMSQFNCGTRGEFARAIDAKLKEKNT